MPQPAQLFTQHAILPHRANRATLSTISTLLLAGTLCGCASDADQRAPESITLSDFRKADSAAEPSRPGTPEMPRPASGVSGSSASAPPAAGVRTVPVVTPAMVGANLPTAAVAMAPIARVSPDAVKDGSPVIVESLVGQINGKPVFAGEFLKPLDKRLATDAAKARNLREWVADSKKTTGTALMTQLQDELFLAEARATLSKEERAGLFTLVSKLRENLTTTNEGSQELANERLLAEEGKTLEEKATDERDKILIRTLVARYITPRVNVSWRDVQREYARSFDKYNPPPTATLRMIWAPRRDADRVAKISARLAAGDSFSELAKDRALNDFNAGEAGLLATKPFDPANPQAKLVEDAKVNEKAIGLTAGQFEGPIESGNRAVWVFMEALDRQPGRDLSEVQLEISAALREKKFAEETSRFINRLVERGSKTDLALMNERLLLIAADRYSGKIGSARPAPAAAQPAASAPAAPATAPAAAPPGTK